jgi:hypothetical protein
MTILEMVDSARRTMRRRRVPWFDKPGIDLQKDPLPEARNDDQQLASAAMGDDGSLDASEGAGTDLHQVVRTVRFLRGHGYFQGMRMLRHGMTQLGRRC